MSRRPAPSVEPSPPARRVVWVPAHRAYCPLTPEDRDVEVRSYDPAAPPPGAPGGPPAEEA